MKKNICLLIGVLFSVTNLCAQDGVSSARWQTNKVVTDGNSNEWAKPLNLYDAESGLLFTVANDSKNLYFCFTSKDARKTSKLMKAGWEISVSSKEKKRKFDASIIFPAVQTISAPGKDQGIMQHADPNLKDDIDLYKINLQTAHASGFVTANGDIPLQTTDKINIGIGADSSQEITFEIAIPFKELFPGNDAELNEELTLGVTVNALKRTSQQDHAADGDSFTTSANGRMSDGGGRMGGGRRGGGNRTTADAADRSQLYSKVSFTQKFRLTNK